MARPVRMHPAIVLVINFSRNFPVTIAFQRMQMFGHVRNGLATCHRRKSFNHPFRMAHRGMIPESVCFLFSMRADNYFQVLVCNLEFRFPRRIPRRANRKLPPIKSGTAPVNHQTNHPPRRECNASRLEMEFPVRERRRQQTDVCESAECQSRSPQESMWFTWYPNSFNSRSTIPITDSPRCVRAFSMFGTFSITT